MVGDNGTKKGGRRSVAAQVTEEKVLAVPVLEGPYSLGKQGHPHRASKGKMVSGIPMRVQAREAGQKMQTWWLYNCPDKCVPSFAASQTEC